MLKRLLIAGAVLAIGALTVWAADPAPAPTPSGEEVFVPSEAISEDFPAPFPVDI
jgi:hypothetical protein